MMGRLRGRSLPELATRLRQQVSRRLDRLGVGRGVRLPEDEPFRKSLGLSQGESLGRVFPAGEGTGAFGGLGNPRDTARMLEKRWPHRAREIVDRAHGIREGRFDLLGLRGVSFGDPVDWHLDPVSGRRAPRLHWSRLDPLDPSQVGDHKVVWELNRHQYFQTLCQAWLLTGDGDHARTVVEHLEEWMDANPPKVGINWASSLELAYRSIAWLWALSLLTGGGGPETAVPGPEEGGGAEPLLPQETLLRALKYLWVQGLHVEAHLSTYFSPNTHLTGEALGLLYLGCFVPNLPDAARWRRLGWRILVDQVGAQVEADGTYFERATYYHRYTVDIYTHALLLGRSMGALRPALETVEERLGALLAHLAALTRPNGTTPLFGDDDGGHLWLPDPSRPDDFRSSLATGAALLGRPDLAFVARDATEEALWLLGPEALGVFDGQELRPPEELSRAFPQGGFFVFRDGWGEDALQAVVDAGPHGVLNCGHAHADALSLDLSVGEEPVLVDPGTYGYVDPQERRTFREGRSHNTATVDGGGSSEPGGPFQWVRVADAEARCWRTGDRFDVLVGEHHGFGHLGGTGLHRREVVFARGHGWLLRDRVEVDEGRRVELTFQGAPGLRAQEEEGGLSFRTEDGEGLLRLWTFPLVGGRVEGALDRGWVSDAYGRKEEAPRWRVGSEVEAAGVELVTLMLPAREDPVLELSRSGGGLVLEVTVAGVRHWIRVGPGSGPALGGWESDGDVLWVWKELTEAPLHSETAGAGPAATAGGSAATTPGAGGAAALATRISRLSLGGKVLLEGGDSIPVQEVQWTGSTWRVRGPTNDHPFSEALS